jgi:cobalt-zinc-cadmium efflux system protein
MAHDHAGHSHGIPAATKLSMLVVALAINVAFMVLEVVFGIVAHSLALLSDAAHMLTDAGAIGLAIVAARLARRQAHGALTFGLKRGEILSAQANGLTMAILAAFIVYEGVSRLVTPPLVEASLVIWVGLAGLFANLAAAWALAKASRVSLNVEGAFQHNLIDALASIAAVIAAAVILLTGFQRADPIASLFVAALMLYSAYGLLKASGRIFLEAAPEGLNPEEIGQVLLTEPGVVEVHDLHVWEVTSGFPALSAHVIVKPEADCHKARLHLAEQLESQFGIHHTTLQVEHQPERLLRIESPSDSPGAT